MTLSMVLTLFAYAVLALFCIYLLAHLLAVGACCLRPSLRTWLQMSREGSARFDAAAGRLEGLLADLVGTETASVPSDEADLARVSLQKELHEQQRIECSLWDMASPTPAAGLLAEALRVAMHAPTVERRWEVEQLLEDDLERWQGRLSMLVVAGPLAGAAPTMSGAMSFLETFLAEAQNGTGALAFAHIKDCLLTTYVGCAIAVVAMTLLCVIAGLHRRHRIGLWSAVKAVIGAREQWAGVYARAAAVAGGNGEDVYDDQ